VSGGGGGDGPGAPLWIISFADMISNLVIFFIVVATFATKNTEDDKLPKRVLERDAGIFGTAKERPRTGFSPRRGPAAQDARPAAEAPSRRHGVEADDLRSSIQDKRYRVSPKVTDVGDGIRILLEESASFAAGGDDLLPEAREIVAEVGRFYAAEPVDFVVEAHTDDRSFRFSRHGSETDLTRAMAAAVGEVLVRDSGIDPPRVGISPLGVERPVEPNTTAAGRARNRRIEIVVRERP
jgi:chemotaxis protein MotB